MATLLANNTTMRPTSPLVPRWAAWSAPLAGVWSLVYGALGLYWALGGAGFPFATSRPESWMSPVADLDASVGGPVIAGLGLTGALVALAMHRDWKRGPMRQVRLGFGWAACLTLLLIVPDTRVLAIVGYLPALIISLGFDAVDWPILNQVVCVAGGFAWGAATLTYQRRTANGDRHIAEPAPKRVVSGPHHWGWWATVAAVLLPLPYAATRLAWAAGYPLGIADPVEAAMATDPGIRISELSLGGMALGGALLTLGLIQRWGEIFPTWAPFLAGRRVPPALAVVPASIASVMLTVGGIGLWRMVLTDGITGPAAVPALVPGLAFLPWGVALGLATLAYFQRRRAVAGVRNRQPAEALHKDGRLIAEARPRRHA